MCNVLFTIFSITSALSPNVAALLVIRSFSGCAGVAALTCGSGATADLVPSEQRGRAMSLWSLGPLFGPVIGRAMGGFLVEATSWRWIFWLPAIAGGVAPIIFVFTVPETYAPIILNRKARKLSENGGELSHMDPVTPSRQLFLQSLVRLAKMLFFWPRCASTLRLYTVCSIFCLLHSPWSSRIYNFSTGATGLNFLGSGIGMLLGLTDSGFLSDNAIKRKTKQGLHTTAEDRLPWYLVAPVL
ncbi:hypothetical protein BBP40_001474 [Aspergillus hancockii]|nr:hypothetical protein BBP40_001474 [Aspergillus hancockii]